MTNQYSPHLHHLNYQRQHHHHRLLQPLPLPLCPTTSTTTSHWHNLHHQHHHQLHHQHHHHHHCHHTHHHHCRCHHTCIITTVTTNSISTTIAINIATIGAKSPTTPLPHTTATSTTSPTFPTIQSLPPQTNHCHNLQHSTTSITDINSLVTITITTSTSIPHSVPESPLLQLPLSLHHLTTTTYRTLAFFHLSSKQPQEVSLSLLSSRWRNRRSKSLKHLSQGKCRVGILTQGFLRVVFGFHNSQSLKKLFSFLQSLLIRFVKLH